MDWEDVPQEFREPWIPYVAEWRRPMTPALTDWQAEVARWFGVPKWLLQTESVIPHRYNQGVDMQVTDAMIRAYGEAWSAQNEKPGNEVGDRRRAGLMAALRAMDATSGMVLMTRELFESLEEDIRKLRALESMGVDNWSGYDHAMREMREQDEAAEDEAQMFRPKR